MAFLPCAVVAAVAHARAHIRILAVADDVIYALLYGAP
jgi:hypothetical protein